MSMPTMDYESPSDEIRSQVGDLRDRFDESDAEPDNTTSVSQANFATQIPWREARLEEDWDHNSPSVMSNTPQRTHANSCLTQGDGFKLPTISKSDESTSALHRSQDTTEAVSELTQRQLIVPSSNIPMQQNKDDSNSNAGLSKLKTGSTKRTSGDEAKQLQHMPAVLTQILRQWRHECHDGRYIPRRLQFIPKDQARLLESDDRWQPPLVGHNPRPGMVPMSILDECTKRADSQYLKPSEDLPAVKSVMANEGLPKQIQQQADGLDESDSESSSECSWSPRPDRNRLPPDSPPLAALRQMGENTRQRQTSPLNANSGRSMEAVAQQEIPSQQVPSSCTIEASSSIKIPKVITSDETVDEMTPPACSGDTTKMPPSTSTKISKYSNRVPPRTILVKRTPFHIKEFLHTDESPDSSGQIIPGTFDEKASSIKASTPILPTGRPGDNESNLTHRKDNFEMDSSDDDFAIEKDRENASEGTGKRRLNDEKSVPPKRVKTTTQNSVDGYNIYPEYISIDADRIRYRRKYLSKISRVHVPVQLTTSSVIRRTISESKSSSPASQSRSDVGSSYLPKHAQNLETLETHFSVHHTDQQQPRFVSVDGFCDNHPVNNTDSSIDLYNEFKAVYPSYAGRKMHFDASCLLLQQLQLKNRSTHPSLWDDFVFRHYHDYREHLRNVMENSGSALPYDKFYEERVEEPTCLRRVVKPTYIKNLPNHRISVSEISLTTPLSRGQNEAHQASKEVVHLANERSMTSQNHSESVRSTSESRRPVTYPDQLAAHATEQKRLSAVEFDEILAQNGVQSRTSQASVNLWLEKAARVESPILGTPRISSHGEMDVSVLDLSKKDANADAGGHAMLPPSAMKAEKGRHRTLPWSRNDLGEELGFLSNMSGSTPAPLEAGSAKRLQKPSEGQDSRLSSANSRMISVQQPRPPMVEPQGSNHTVTADPEAAFQRFVRFYNNLPSEKQASSTTSKATGQFIDIFTWRE